MFLLLALALPLWIPLIFLSYFFGRGQFSLKSLFILTTAEAISLGAASFALAAANAVSHFGLSESPIVVAMLMTFTLPFGTPAVLTAHAIGRKSFGKGFWFYFFVLETASLAISCAGLPVIN